MNKPINHRFTKNLFLVKQRQTHFDVLYKNKIDPNIIDPGLTKFGKQTNVLIGNFIKSEYPFLFNNERTLVMSSPYSRSLETLQQLCHPKDNKNLQYIITPQVKEQNTGLSQDIGRNLYDLKMKFPDLSKILGCNIYHYWWNKEHLDKSKSDYLKLGESNNVISEYDYDLHKRSLHFLEFISSYDKYDNIVLISHPLFMEKVIQNYNNTLNTKISCYHIHHI